jgi:hypothetical protein
MKFQTVLGLCAVFMLGFACAYAYNVSVGHVSPRISVNMEYVFELSDGTVCGSTGNIITDIGDQYVSNLTVNRAMSGFSYGSNGTVFISLGNSSTISYSDTKLLQEAVNSGFSRTDALTPTYSSGSGIGNGNYYNFTVTNKFTATATIAINATGLQWDGTSNSDNNLFAEANIGTLPTGQVFNANDNCTITWTITFQH